MKILITILILLSSISVYSKDNESDILIKEINNDLFKLNRFSETINTDQSFDPDSLSNSIAQKIIAYIQKTGFDNFNAALFTGVEIAYRENNAPFWVLTYSYYSGGSAGLIPTSIIIKQTENGYTCYNMSRYEAAFYDFYKLVDTIYLCFATTPGWGACANNGIYAFDFQEQAIPIEVFNDKSYFSICNSDLSFDSLSKILTMDVNNIPFYNEGKDYNAYFEKEGLNFFKIINYDIEDNDFMGTLVTKFDGRRFVQP